MRSEADRVIIFYKASKTHLPNLIRSIISVCINQLIDSLCGWGKRNDTTWWGRNGDSNSRLVGDETFNVSFRVESVNSL